MAEFGLRHLCFKPHGAETGVVLGRACVANLAVTLASGELYADDGLAEQVSEFASGTLSAETDDMEDASAAVVYDATVVNGEVIYNRDDNPPRGTIGYVKCLMVRGVKKYRAYILLDGKAAIGNDDGQTRGNNITFNTVKTTFTIFADDDGNWRKTKTFTSLPAALAYVDGICGTGGSSAPNANLAALTIGTLRLSPAFDPAVTQYAATATGASDAVTAIAAADGATVAITNGETVVTNGGSASWTTGKNTVTILVTNGTVTKTYTVEVTKGA